MFVKISLKYMLITIYEFLEYMENMSNSHLGDKLMQFVTTLRVTRSYYDKCHEELSNMLHQIVSSILLFTLSTTNMYQPNLYSLMLRTTPNTPCKAKIWKKNNVINYLHLVIKYMCIYNIQYSKNKEYKNE